MYFDEEEAKWKPHGASPVKNAFFLLTEKEMKNEKEVNEFIKNHCEILKKNFGMEKTEYK